MQITDLETKINTCGCPKCCGGVAVTVKMHLFGKSTIKAQCTDCGYEIKSSKISSFPTPLEIAKCISATLSEWNNNSLAQRKTLRYEDWHGSTVKRGVQYE